MKTLYESLLDDEEDMINDEAAVEFEQVKSCFDIGTFHPGEKSQYLKQKPNGHYEYKLYVWSKTCNKLINLNFPAIFDYINNLDFNGITEKLDWNDHKDIKIIFKYVESVIFLNHTNLPKWITSLNIEKCETMKIFCHLDERVYILPNTQMKNLNIYITPKSIVNTLWQVPGLELLIGNYKNINAENVTFCTDQMIIRGIIPFDDPRYGDDNYKILKIDEDKLNEFDDFFANNPKVKHLYVFMSHSRRKSLYYEVLPMRTKGKFKLKKTTLHDEDFD